MKCVAAALCGLVSLVSQVSADDPVALRIESLLVAPSHTPSAVVLVRNLQDAPYRGTIQISGPDGWRFDPSEKPIEIDAGEVAEVRFLVKQARGNEENGYPLTARAVGSGGTVTKTQNVLVTSAPYFKPEIDGQVDDWKDSIPVSWETQGKTTVIRTFWNRRRFAMLIEVEEDDLRRANDPEPERCDALQIAIAPGDARTPNSADQPAVRFEFLITAVQGATTAKCFLLAEPGMPLAKGQTPRGLTSLHYDDAEVAVRREGATTYYELSLPFRPMRDLIRPSEGREFCLSLLVHDPDGTGIRDWGVAAGLWPEERSRLAWSKWAGAVWDDDPPFDNKTPWGLCSSKY
jgi:hypothetical protein